MATNLSSRLRKLGSIIENQEFVYPSGTLPLLEGHSVLYYGKDASALGRVDFLDATEAQLQHLAETCDPASFGRGQEDVYDESYRKAGKLDKAHFATNFHPVVYGLIDKIQDILLEGNNSEKSLHAELYKMNVYGPGSFFKQHKDTPRGNRMFASLVVVLPTAHKGGDLVFRRGDEEIGRFDSASAIANASTPSIAFVAFYSDVEHEVAEVEAGYRVTLTYNLFLTNGPKSLASTPMVLDFAVAIGAELCRVLQKSSFLPDGGFVGFGLRHEYPTATSIVEGTIA